jgi:hypothetical protein
MFDDIESSGFGLSYLGIKPNAAGVIPIAPAMPQQMPAQQMPKFSGIGGMMKGLTQSPVNPAHVASPLPLSQPKNPAQMRQPKPQIDGVANPIQQPAPSPQLSTPPAPQITGPMEYQNLPGLPLASQFQPSPLASMPTALQPKPMTPEPQKLGFNKLSGLLNKGQMK